MKIAIVDDEKKCRENAILELRKYGESEEFEIDEYASGEAFLDADKEYEIVFMDVEMSGMNGFETIMQYRKHHRTGIHMMLTTHMELIRDGYLVEAFRYLDKGNLAEELPEALEGAKNKMRGNRTICIPVPGMGEYKVMLRQIVYVETSGRKVQIHTTEQSFSTNMGLGEVEELLDEQIFYRCHKSYIVNLDEVEFFDHKYIYLRDKERIHLGTKKHAQMKQRWIQRHINSASG